MAEIAIVTGPAFGGKSEFALSEIAAREQAGELGLIPGFLQRDLPRAGTRRAIGAIARYDP